MFSSSPLRPLRWLLLAGLIATGGLSGSLPTGQAQEQPGAEPAFQRAPDPKAHPGPDADLFVQGVALQRKRKWISARRKFWRLIDKYPDSLYAAEAADRSEPNAFLGIRAMGPTGPSERRIDVALMGDGYRIKKQKRYDEHCEGQLKVLLGEELYEVYRPYFNFWQFNLASEDKGVDEPTPPEADEELNKRRRGRHKKKAAKQFSTALDCKAAGPQGQVWANPRRVWHYLQYLEDNDGLVIVFAQMGRLGMGGMGIATTGPRGVVVHEFGHAFIGLLDEYANNPGAPRGALRAANATTDPKHPPWQHFLDAHYKGVGVYEGGATYKKGVWRPAPGCAMNSGGGSPYCPVCREAGVLRIYERVSPIDQAWPAEDTIRITAGVDKLPAFSVLPMQPAGHKLKVRWILGAATPVTTSAGQEDDDTGAGDEQLDPFEKRLRRLRRLRERAGKGGGGPRMPIGFRRSRRMRARGTAGTPLPKGSTLRSGPKKKKGVGRVNMPRLPRELDPGRYVLTVIVWDPAKPKGAKRPWVLKDPRGLLEDRHTWTIEVREKPSAAKDADAKDADPKDDGSR